MLLAILLSAVILQSPSIGDKRQNPSQKKENIPTKLQASTPEPSPVVVNNLHAAEQETKPKEQSKWWPPPPLWDIFWPTCALVIFTAFTVRYALKTLKAIREQVEEMKKTGVQTDKLITESIAQTTSLVQQAQSLAQSAYHLRESANATYRSPTATQPVTQTI